MRGRIVNYIFLMFRPMRVRFFRRQKSFGMIGMLKHVDAVVKIGCERKNCYRIPAWFGFSLFFGPAEIVFSDSDPDPHFPCVKLKLSGC